MEPVRFSFSREKLPSLLDNLRTFFKNGGTRIIASGPTDMDKTLLAQRLADEFKLDLLKVSLKSGRRVDNDEQKRRLMRLVAYARTEKSVILLENANPIFSSRVENPIAKYLISVSREYDGIIIFAVNSKRSIPASLSEISETIVEFEGQRKPDSPASNENSDNPLPVFNFDVKISSRSIGFCSVSQPSITGGYLSGENFDPFDKSQSLEETDLSLWPTVTLKRGITRSNILFQWRKSIINKKQDLRDIEIIHFDTARDTIVNRWKLIDCWPKRWSGPFFDALNQEIGYEEIEIFFRDIRWEK